MAANGKPSKAGDVIDCEIVVVDRNHEPASTFNKDAVVILSKLHSACLYFRHIDGHGTLGEVREATGRGLPMRTKAQWKSLLPEGAKLLAMDEYTDILYAPLPNSDTSNSASPREKLSSVTWDGGSPHRSHASSRPPCMVSATRRVSAPVPLPISIIRDVGFAIVSAMP